MFEEESESGLEIVEKRVELDQVISNVPGVQFFLSSITGTSTNSKKTATIRPGISFFICYRKNSYANQMTIFQHLHDSGMDATVAAIKTKPGD